VWVYKTKIKSYIYGMLTKFVICKKNLINNVKQVKLKNPNSRICAMVKANAYGVGVKQVVKILNNHVDFFGVACFFEAKKIKNLTNKKILIVGALEKDNINTRFSYTCSSLQDVKFLKKLNRKINIHLKINSGMNRYGFNNLAEFELALNEIKNSKLNLEGVFTHFATTDNFVKTQMEIFNKYIKIINQYKFKIIIHADNSSVNLKYNHNLNMVRIGFNLFNFNKYNFKSVVKIKSKIVQINNIKKGELVGYNKKYIANKNKKIAVIPVGYADGFSTKNIDLTIFVKNKYCKVLNVCMDCFMLDVTNLNIKKGDNIYILNKHNSLKKYSNHLKISEYEVMCNFSKIRADKIIN